MVSRQVDRTLVPLSEVEEHARNRWELFAGMVLWTVHGEICDVQTWWLE